VVFTPSLHSTEVEFCMHLPLLSKEEEEEEEEE